MPKRDKSTPASYGRLLVRISELIEEHDFDQQSVVEFIGTDGDLDNTAEWITKKPQMLRLALSLMTTAQYWLRELGEDPDMTEDAMLRNLTLAYLETLKGFQEVQRETFDRRVNEPTKKR